MTSRVQVVAIVNRTPDSFHDRGRTFALAAAVEAGLRAHDQGADWVDVGGCPIGRAHEVSEAEELDRVVPVVAELRERRPELPVMVDTFRGTVARETVAVGAAGVNDTSGLHDPHMAAVAAETGVLLVLTHSRTWPDRDLPRPAYTDVVDDVRTHLAAMASQAVAAGVDRGRIVVDPGHGLWKSGPESLDLTRRLAEITSGDYPVMVAISNKDFVREVVGSGQLLAGTLAATVLAVRAGARYVRAHDVAATVAAVRMAVAVGLDRREGVPSHGG